MLTFAVLGATATLAALVTLSRVIGLRRLLGIGLIVDVSFTLSCAWLFYGTLTGIMAATLAGLFMALTISALRALIGYQRPHLYLCGLRPCIIWINHPPRWQISLAKRRAGQTKHEDNTPASTHRHHNTTTTRRTD